MNTQSKNVIPPIKPKDENLRKTVQGFKLVKLQAGRTAARPGFLRTKINFIDTFSTNLILSW